MNKVYVLRESTRDYPNGEIIGVISAKHVSDRWNSINGFHWTTEIELDSPELLNRIAKESDIQNKKESMNKNGQN